jgi:PknH-like extracellular domain
MQQRMVLALAGTCILAAGCSATSHRATPIASTSSTTAPPVAATAPPVAAAALDGLLLSAAEINTAMGATQLSVAVDTKQMDDVSAMVSRPECLPIYSPAEVGAYAGSGWTAVHRQDLSDPTHAVVQSVVLFPSARQAAAFFTASAKSWQACSNGSFDHVMSGGHEVWDVGPISNTNGILSTVAQISLEVDHIPATPEGSLTGQRVLTVRNNVVIDILADSTTANDPAAFNIAAQIAAKVPTK